MSTLQTSRYELKHLVSESQAAKIKQMVACRLKPDEHTDTESIGYRVRSLYLDSRSLSCYNQTQCGEKNRFKLRIRFYDDTASSPVFLEIKRRITNVILKQRAAVSREAAEHILRGSAPSPTMLIRNIASQREALQEFCHLRNRLAATGSVFVDYYRQAFETRHGNTYRVTFDRMVRGCEFTPGQGLKMPPRSVMSKIDGVILEMKYVGRPAPWMKDLARQFGLQARSVPKYVECVDVLHPPSCSPIKQEPLRG